MEGFAEGLLAVRWPGEERLRRFPLILPKHDIGEFQFKFCGDASSLSEKPGPDYGDEAEAENILKTLPSFCCDPSDDCRGGQFVTHYEKSFLGLRVKHCRKPGMRRSFSNCNSTEEMASRKRGSRTLLKEETLPSISIDSCARRPQLLIPECLAALMLNLVPRQTEPVQTQTSVNTAR